MFNGGQLNVDFTNKSIGVGGIYITIIIYEKSSIKGEASNSGVQELERRAHKK